MVKQRSLTVNSMLNVVRQICAVIFPLITFPYATRVLGTANYGMVSFGLSIISYIALIANLGVIEYAIREGAKVRDNKREFQMFSSQMLSINLLSTVFSLVLLLVLILFWKRLDGYAILLMIQSIGVISTTIGTDWINSAYEDYLFITVRYIVCSLLSLVLMFIMVRSSDDYLAYAFFTISSNLFANVLNFIHVRKRYDIHPRFTLDMDLKIHLKPVFILFGSSIAAFVYINSDVLMLGIMKDNATVGIYSAGSRIYLMVKQILNAALVVMIPRISNNIANRIDNSKLLQTIRTACILVLLPATAGLYLVGDKLILLMSGSEYLPSADIIRVLAIALFFATSGCYYISVVMIPYGKEKWVMTGSIAAALVNIILNIILIPRYGGVAAAWSTVFSEMIMFITGVACTRGIVKIRFIKPYLISLLCVAFIVLEANIVNTYVDNLIVQLILTVLLGVAGAAILTVPCYYGEIKEFIR